MDKKHIASIDVDAQRGFTSWCPGELPIAEGHMIVGELNANAKLAGHRVGSKDAHPPNPAWVANNKNEVMEPVEPKIHNVDVKWPLHCVMGRNGSELLPGLPHPQDYDYFVWKGMERDMHPYGACFHDLHDELSTGLIEWMDYNNIYIVIVGGLATDYCVYNTVKQLTRFTNCAVIVNLAACRGVSDDTTKTAIEDMERKGARIGLSAVGVGAILDTFNDTEST